MSKVYCSINNCHYWKEENLCGANEIIVTSDSLGETAPDSFDAPLHQQFQSTPAASCMETCCKTFVEKGSGKEKEDGVMKS
ncbi:MAG: DUF1540 domain-containing protein [Dethiobacteria bacterium]|jgi:hypothetical protein|nr:DUF1540 domain-containing protein [Bacillota bacterium]